MMPMPAVFDQMHDWAKQRIAAMKDQPKARDTLHARLA